MTHDFIILGGGLAGSVLAYRLKTINPSWSVVVIERSVTLGGNHTWCFHDSDLTVEQLSWVDALVSARWDAYEVRFRGFQRVLNGGYRAIQSTRLHEVVASVLGAGVLLGREVAFLKPGTVHLTSGEVVTGRHIIDSRGIEGWQNILPEKSFGCQKFLGMDLLLKEPHGLLRPVLMDATCVQNDGYRFFYLLPWSENRLLIEETRYSLVPGINQADSRTAIIDYAALQGWRVAAIEREEQGVLPLPLNDSFDRSLQSLAVDGENTTLIKFGMRAGLFHQTTGYSLPFTVAAADQMAAHAAYSDDDTNTKKFFENKGRKHWQSQSYFRLLNRMLFWAAAPEASHRIFKKFYGLPEGLIRNFYSSKLTWSDKMRILSGKPPVPVMAALPCFFGKEPRNATTAFL